MSSAAPEARAVPHPARRRRLRWVCAAGALVGLVLLVLMLAPPGLVLAKASVIEYAACRWFSPDESPETAPVVIAHRGYVPDESTCENSAASIEAALAAGCRAIEIDVNFTRDLIPVLFHDDALMRLTGREGTLGDLDWSYLRRIPLRDGQPILSLADFWRRCAGRFELVCIDVKGADQRAPERARALSEALPPMTHMPRTIVIGVPYHVLRETAKLRPNLSYACEIFGVIANRLAGFDAVSAGPDKFSPGQAWLARRLTMTYVTWTLNTPEQIAAAEAAGVDAYMTDRLVLSGD